MKAAVFMIACLLAISSADRESDHVSFKEDVLTSEIRYITGQAILTPANVFPTAVESVSLPENKNHFSFSNKFDYESRLTHQRFIALGKIWDNIIPLHATRYFLKLIPANKDDLPDLS